MLTPSKPIKRSIPWVGRKLAMNRGLTKRTLSVKRKFEFDQDPYILHLDS